MKAVIFLAVLLAAALPLTGETSDTTPAQKTAAAKESLSTEYRGIKLGMGIDAVKEALKQDELFGYRGERDVSLLAVKNRSLIESAGSFFISRSWFQFYEESLYTMIFKLNTDTVDYYSIYSKFCEKYGEPSSINPKRAVWEDEKTRIVIERPLIVKYIDLKVFNELVTQSADTKTTSDINKKAFIDGF